MIQSPLKRISSPIPPRKQPQAKIPNNFLLSGKEQILPNKPVFNFSQHKHLKESSHFSDGTNHDIFQSPLMSRRQNKISNPMYENVPRKVLALPMKKPVLSQQLSNEQSNFDGILIYQNLAKNRSELIPVKPKRKSKQKAPELPPKNPLRAKSFENLLFDYKNSINNNSIRDITKIQEKPCKMFTDESLDIVNETRNKKQEIIMQKNRSKKLHNKDASESMRCHDKKILFAKNSIIEDIKELEELVKNLPSFNLESEKSHISKSKYNQTSPCQLENAKPETRLSSHRRSLTSSLISNDFDKFITMLNQSKFI